MSNIIQDGLLHIKSSFIKLNFNKSAKYFKIKMTTSMKQKTLLNQQILNTLMLSGVD